MSRPAEAASPGGVALVRRFLPYAEAAFVALVAWWMLHVRMLPFDKFATPDAVYFIGTDPYYHLRAVLVSVASFPDLLRFDPFTQFPKGTETGQFGTLFDLLIALAARLTGDPSDFHHVARVTAAAPAFFGALISVPVYLIARRLGGRIAAVWSVVVLALLPGEFLIRSLAAYTDHHVAEALFSTAAVLGVLWATDAGRRLGTGIPAWKALAPSAAGAIGLFLYIWTWPPGVLFVAILGLFVLVQLLLDHVGGKDAKGFAWAMALAFGGAAVLTLPLVEHASFAFNLFSLIQPASLAAVAAGALLIEYASALSRRFKVHVATLPLATVAAAVLAFVGLAALAPELYGMLKWGFSWITGIGTTPNILTIQEARATCDARGGESFPFCATFARSYAFTLWGALLAVPLLAWDIARRRRPGDLLLLVWLGTMLIAATNQVRFNYYLAVPVALANGWLAYWVARVTGLLAAFERLGAEKTDAKRGGAGRKARAAGRAGFAWYQPLAVAAVALLVVPGLVDGNQRTLPANELAALFDPDHEVVLWHTGLAWMKTHTPGVGLDLGRAYEAEGFQYPPGAYGVMSWWDYGHWIEVLGERPPVANPFQQHAPFMSTWFTETNPAAARAQLVGLAGDPYRIRYVMISDTDALGKYGAITVWANQQNESRPLMGRGDTVRTATLSVEGKPTEMRVLGPAYTDSMMYRLYFGNAETLPEYRLVYAYPGSNCVGHVAVPRAGAAPQLARFNDYIRSGPCLTNGDAQFRRETAVRRTGEAFVYEFADTPSLKIFEHVRGANLTGTAPAGSAVAASVTIAIPFNGATAPFTVRYATTAAADGTWSMRVPYSTSEFLAAADGATDLSGAGAVRPSGPYRVEIKHRPTLDVHVPERAVLEGRSVSVPIA